MVEDGRSLQQRPGDRDIVIRSEQSSIEQVGKNPFLERVGFSPQLPQRLMRLNDVIAGPPLNSVGILMVPGKTPLITTNVSHDSGIRVYVEGTVHGTASIQLGHKENIVSFALIVAIEDIQDFVKSLFPNSQARIFSRASDDLEEPISGLNEDLYAIGSNVLKSLHEFRHAKKFNPDLPGTPIVLPYHEFEVIVSGQKLPEGARHLLSFHLISVHYSDEIGCAIKEFNYEGRPEEVEGVMDKVADLFDKPMLYPFKDREK